jgi:hypothetical protein
VPVTRQTEDQLAPLRPVAPVSLAQLEGAEDVNREILAQYLELRDHPATRRTHWMRDRYENTYIDAARIPALQLVIAAAAHYARQLLGREELKFGYWFNEMQPGQRTTLHSHDEADELLSCVYYVTAPALGGRLELHDEPALLYVEPTPGLFVFFAPQLPHAVEPNRSQQLRLSVAFNFGPAS